MTLLFKDSWFSSRLQKSEQSQWRYVSAQNSWQKAVAGLSILKNTLSLNLLCQFRKATGEAPQTGSRLHHTMVHEGTDGPLTVLKKQKLRIDCLGKWDKAKTANDFSVVAPAFQKMVDAYRDEALKKKDKLGVDSAYDAVLDYYMPGLRSEYIERLIPDLVTFCNNSRDLLLADEANKIEKQPQQPQASFDLSAETQAQISAFVLNYIGVDTDSAVRKTTPHPLCLGVGDDVGIGMRYDEADFWPVIMTSIHEGGHALYRQALGRQNTGLQAQVAGAGLDEAMALGMECHAGMNKGYAKALFNKLAQNFDLPCTVADMLERMHRLDHSTIRTKADEVRYPLDAILRFRVEKALFDGDLKVKDLPDFWNREYKRLTGMEVADDRNGVLQDIHMYAGAFGWSPNYLYGKLAAAQISEAAFAADNRILPAIERGDNGPFRDWLQQNIYSRGRPGDSAALIKEVTGSELNTAAYKKHIIERFFRDNDGKGPATGFTPPRPDLPSQPPL